MAKKTTKKTAAKQPPVKSGEDNATKGPATQPAPGASEADGRPLHPTDVAKPSGTDDRTNPLGAEERPTAREGLKPTGTEIPHPTAAARVGKTSGQVIGTPAAAQPSPDATVAEPRTITVEATQMGYYDHVRRRIGDVFDVSEKEFSDRWMRAVDPRAPRRVTTSQAALDAENADVRRAKQQAARPGIQTGDDRVSDVKPGEHNPLGGE